MIKYNRSWIWSAVYIVVLAVASVLASSSGIFNFKEATEYASRDIFYRAWGAEYPRDLSPKTAVVLMNDRSLGQTGSWPAPYESHAALLRALLKYQPAAVMLDIGFVDERQDASLVNLIEVLKIYQQRGIRVYMAAASQGSGATRSIRKELAALEETNTIKLVSIELGQERGRMYSYALSANDNGHLPAARAIYEDHCRSQDNFCASLAHDSEFEVWWAAQPHALNCERSVSCGNITPNGWLRMARLGLNWVSGTSGLLTVEEQDPVQVFYTPTVEWGQLIGGELSEEFGRHLRGSTIFYGLDLALIRDEIYSPVHGEGGRRELPGVYFHAMAFDNLVALGERRIRTVAPSGLSGVGHMSALIIICCAICLLGRFLCLAFGVAGFAAWTDWILFFSTALSVSAIEFYFLHTSPANWLGVIFSMAPMKIADAAGWTEKMFNGVAFLHRKVFG
jgi:CHASE2 domain-containing sensor protein